MQYLQFSRWCSAPALAALALTACGDNLAGPPEDTGVPLRGRTLTGEHVVRFRGYDGSVLSQYPVDQWDAVIEAHAPDGESWRVLPGQGHRDGSFEIDDLPDGPVWLRVARRPAGESFYWTDADHVAFDESVLGPEDGPRANEGDQLRLAIDGLMPWREGDELSWYVPDDSVLAQNVVSPAPPAIDATDLAGVPIDWTGQPLAEVEAGEHAFLVQTREQTINGLRMRAPVRAASPTFHQVAGNDNTLTATLSAAPVLPYRFLWARDVFEAERTAIHPTRAGASYYHDFSINALATLVGGEVWVGMELRLASFVDQAVLEGTTLLDLGELAIPNPYPREWVSDSHVVVFPVDLPLPDGQPATLDAAIGVRRLELSGEALAPAITPIRAPAIAGRNAFEDLSGVGTTPVVSWQRPATGTPSSYRLQVIEAVTAPPFPLRPGWYLTADLVVPGDVTSVRVPADVLQAGVTYALVVRATAQPGQDIATQPFRTSGAAAFADLISGRFTP